MEQIDILVSEVGPRDGLQSLQQIMPTAAKCEWISLLAAAGVREVEVGSFVPASVLPQMADTAEVVAHAKTIPGLDVAVLVPNLRGAENAVKAGADKISIPLSVSETHSLKNVRRSHTQMLEEIHSIAELIAAQPAERRPYFEVGLSTAFGCTLEGPVSEELVVRLAVLAIEAGAAEVGLSDTTGYANPAQVRRLVKKVWDAVGRERLNGVHLHNTRGQGLANALAAMDIGITTVDASMGGIGGCPFAPGASGNIVTEDLVFLVEAMGLRTGIDFDGLLRARNYLAGALPGVEIFGFTPEAGLPRGFQNT
ncbi:hydroxymethylglutaryl-CoA lyase [Microbulbifer bruguierae]|uniref:Hydroxymethylglutaryl-CoA lyase n=1 Tax=Microbulbifer bruguierae TaxID=3029061 RepID=A0ABY8NBK1_9GAMM|nr:hydroxymethylglutaryl-CoA lyase [Microbulbifer bruguierae]WGL16296.1 hydroxymethylglutaryl-CoA lyase [Microbulbifer bruguierae]